MQPAFYGIGAAVVAIIARSAWKLARMVLRQDRVLWAIFVVLGVSTAATGREIVWLFLLGGVVAFLAKGPAARCATSCGIAGAFAGRRNCVSGESAGVRVCA